MATLTVYGRQSTGGLQQAASADVLVVPNTIQSFAGQQLTISSLVGALQIGGTGLVIQSGSGGLDGSSNSGPFKTTGGAVTIGPGAISVSGSATMQAGTTFATTGSGNINLPNNGSARFQVEGVSVSANVTAPNLGTLTAGSASNADSLHTHATATSTTNNITGLTLFSTPVTGELGYFSGNNTVSRAIATAMSTSRAIGAYAGTSGALSAGPRVSILLDAGLTVAAGQPIYVSAATAGRGTNVAPNTATQVEAQVAILADASGYSSGAGSAQSCIWQPKDPIQL